MKQQNDPTLTGQRLVADFQSVLLARATSQAAAQEAERSESELMRELTTASRGMYLNPQALSDVDGGYMVRASLDAHIKKVQAEQLQSMSNAQIGSLIAEDQALFKGKRVRITADIEDFEPYDAVWFDQHTGYRTSPYKKKVIEGEVEEVRFEKNMLLIKPKRWLRLVNSNLQLYVVYVINPETLKPAVTIELL